MECEEAVNVEQEGGRGAEKYIAICHCTFLPTHAHTPLVSFWTVQCVAGSPPRSPPLSGDAQTVTVWRPIETNQLPANGRIQHFIQ